MQNSNGSGDASATETQAPDAPAQLSKAMPYRASCTECGTIASVREIESLRDAGRQESVDIKVARRDAGVASAGAIDPTRASERIYEITVRFRDGTTTVFNEPGPPTWRAGNRVIVIAGARPSTD